MGVTIHEPCHSYMVYNRYENRWLVVIAMEDIELVEGCIYVKALLVSMKESVPKCLEWNGHRYYRKSMDEAHRKPFRNKSKLEKYVTTLKPGEKFTLEDFLKVEPQQKNSKYLSTNVSYLIQKNMIYQIKIHDLIPIHQHIMPCYSVF